MAQIGSQIEDTMAKIKVSQVMEPGRISKNLIFVLSFIGLVVANYLKLNLLFWQVLNIQKHLAF